MKKTPNGIMAFLAILTWEEHELREDFYVAGRRVFCPHQKYEGLIF